MRSIPRNNLARSKTIWAHAGKRRYPPNEFRSFCTRLPSRSECKNCLVGRSEWEVPADGVVSYKAEWPMAPSSCSLYTSKRAGEECPQKKGASARIWGNWYIKRGVKIDKEDEVLQSGEHARELATATTEAEHVGRTTRLPADETEAHCVLSTLELRLVSTKDGAIVPKSSRTTERTDGPVTAETTVL